MQDSIPHHASRIEVVEQPLTYVHGDGVTLGHCLGEVRRVSLSTTTSFCELASRNIKVWKSRRSALHSISCCAEVFYGWPFLSNSQPKSTPQAQLLANSSTLTSTSRFIFESPCQTRFIRKHCSLCHVTWQRHVFGCLSH